MSERPQRSEITHIQPGIAPEMTMDHPERGNDEQMGDSGGLASPESSSFCSPITKKLNKLLGKDSESGERRQPRVEEEGSGGEESHTPEEAQGRMAGEYADHEAPHGRETPEEATPPIEQSDGPWPTEGRRQVGGRIPNNESRWSVSTKTTEPPGLKSRWSGTTGTTTRSHGTFEGWALNSQESGDTDPHSDNSSTWHRHPRGLAPRPKSQVPADTHLEEEQGESRGEETIEEDPTEG